MMSEGVTLSRMTAPVFEPGTSEAVGTRVATAPLPTTQSLHPILRRGLYGVCKIAIGAEVRILLIFCSVGLSISLAFQIELKVPF